MTRRHYSNTATQQTTTASMTSSDVSLTIANSFAGWPTLFPFYATISIGKADMEIVSVTAISGATATIVRGQGGTSSIGHQAGVTFDFTIVAEDVDEPNQHIAAVTGVHGIAGSLVGDTDAQTLTNKTLTAPVMTAPVITGGVTTDSETVSGVLSVAGSITTPSLTVTGSLSASGSVTAADLTVTGKVILPPGRADVADANNAVDPGAYVISTTNCPTADTYIITVESISAGDVIQTAKKATNAILSFTVWQRVWDAGTSTWTPWALMSGPMSSRIWYSGTGNVATGNQTLGVGVWDHGSVYGAGSWSASGLVIGTTGTYLLSGGVTFDATNITGRRGVWYSVNGTAEPIPWRTIIAPATGGTSVPGPVYTRDLNAGDLLSLIPYHTAGVTIGYSAPFICAAYQGTWTP